MVKECRAPGHQTYIHSWPHAPLSETLDGCSPPLGVRPDSFWPLTPFPASSHFMPMSQLRLLLVCFYSCLLPFCLANFLFFQRWLLLS